MNDSYKLKHLRKSKFFQKHHDATGSKSRSRYDQHRCLLKIHDPVHTQSHISNVTRLHHARIKRFGQGLSLTQTYKNRRTNLKQYASIIRSEKTTKPSFHSPILRRKLNSSTEIFIDLYYLIITRYIS